jgi:hypothetical protein
LESLVREVGYPVSEVGEQNDTAIVVRRAMGVVDGVWHPPSRTERNLWDDGGQSSSLGEKAAGLRHGVVVTRQGRIV